MGGSRLARLEEGSVLRYDEASQGDALIERSIRINNCLLSLSLLIFFAVLILLRSGAPDLMGKHCYLKASIASLI
jgi:hypothetical protein